MDINPFITVMKCLMSAQCRDVGEPSRLNLPFAVLYAFFHETLSLNRHDMYCLAHQVSKRSIIYEPGPVLPRSSSGRHRAVESQVHPLATETMLQ